MNKGIEILLARMESHPDEFVPSLYGNYPDKWSWILRKIDARMEYLRTKHTNHNSDLVDIQLAFLDDDEIFAIHEKMQSIRGELFTKQIMDTLLRDETVDDTLPEELSSFSSNRQTKGKTFKLNATELSLAKRLGVSPIGFARMKADMEANRK